MRALLRVVLLCSTLFSAAAAAFPGVPAPSAEERAMVKEAWLKEPYPCTQYLIQPKRKLYHACIKVFVSRLPAKDPAHPDHFGQDYDPVAYFHCRMKSAYQTAAPCFHFIVRRPENPETWPYHDHSPMKWPEAPKQSVYREGMGPIEYWRALCKSEAGEFIYKTVKNVEGFFLIRPRAKENDLAMRDPYVMEDPYGYIDGELGTLGFASGFIWLIVGPEKGSSLSAKRYLFAETPQLIDNIFELDRRRYDSSFFSPPNLNRPFLRFSGYLRRELITMRMERVAQLKSEYGVTWRGISRPHDRDIGVAGGELAVVNLKTGSILALRRGFILGRLNRQRHVGWGGGNVCPEYFLMPGTLGERRHRSKDFDFSLWFINRVLVPRHQDVE